MRSQAARKEFLLQTKPNRRPRLTGQRDALWSREAAERESPQNRIFGLRQPGSVAFQQKGALAGESTVGACWHKLSIILHSMATTTGSAPALLRNHQQVPAPQRPPFFSSTKGCDWTNCSKEEKLGNKQLSQVYLKLLQKLIAILKTKVLLEKISHIDSDCNSINYRERQYTTILHMAR